MLAGKQKKKAQQEAYAAGPPMAAPEGMIWGFEKGRWILTTPFGKMGKRLVKQVMRQYAERVGIIAPRAGRPGAGVYVQVPPTTQPGAFEDPTSYPPAYYPDGTPIPQAYYPDGTPIPPGYYPTQSYPGGYYPTGYPVPAEAPPYAVFEGESDEIFDNNRVIYGSTHTPMDYAAVMEDIDAWDQPFSDYDEGTDYLPGPALDLTPFSDWDDYAGGSWEQLGGIADWFSLDYWKNQYNQTLAKFQSQVAKFYQLKAQLYKDKSLLDAAHRAQPDNLTINGLLDDLNDQIDKQISLESQVSGVIIQLSSTTAAAKMAAGMGAIAIPLALLATAAAIAAAVYVHQNAVNETHYEIDLVARKVLSAGEIAGIKAGGVLGGAAGVLRGAGGLLLVGVLGYAAWKLLPTRGGR